MSVSSKYLLMLLVIAAALIVLALLAPFIAGLVGDRESVAELEIVLCWLFILTCPVSLGFAIWASLKKEWKRSALYAIGASLPWVTMAVVMLAIARSTKP